MAIQIESVKTDTFSMRFFRFGKGEKTLVILPGLSVQSVMDVADAVASAYESLKDAFTIYVFDRRTELPPEYSIQEMARDTALAFQELCLKKVCLFGASQGGMIALVIAIEHPELVDRLVLGSSSAHVREAQYRVMEEWIDLAKRGDSEGLYLSFGKEVYPEAIFNQYREILIETAKTVTETDLERFIILARGTGDFNVVDQLPKIQCPVLAIGDFEDQVLDSDATMEIAENLDYRPDFRLYMYIGYGHAAYDTAPDYRKRILDFFSN